MKWFFGGILIVLLPLLHLPVGAAVWGGHQVEVLEMGYAAAPMAVADSLAAISKNPYAGLYNPASAIGLTGTQLHSSHTQLENDIEIFSLGGVTSPHENWVYGLLWTEYQVSAIPLIATDTASPTEDLESTSNSTFSSHAFTGHIAYSPFSELALGVNVTGFVSRLSGVDGGDGWGYTIAPGVRYAVSNSLAVGAYIQNLLSYAQWGTGTEEQFSRVAHVGAEWLGWGAQWTVEYVAMSGGWLSGETRVGVSLPLWNIITLRAGAYPTHFTTGVGLQFDRVTLDYAFTGDSQNRLSDTSRFNIGVKL